MPNTVVTLIVVNLLVEFLPRLGVNLGNDVITGMAQGIVAIASAVWGYFHYKTVLAAAVRGGYSPKGR